MRGSRTLGLGLVHQTIAVRNLPVQLSELNVRDVDDQEGPSMCWEENKLMHLTFMTWRETTLMIVLAQILDVVQVTCTIDRTLLFNYRECNDAYSCSIRSRPAVRQESGRRFS
jgi:hypothetical protein